MSLVAKIHLQVKYVKNKLFLIDHREKKAFRKEKQISTTGSSLFSYNSFNLCDVNNWALYAASPRQCITLDIRCVHFFKLLFSVL